MAISNITHAEIKSMISNIVSDANTSLRAELLNTITSAYTKLVTDSINSNNNRQFEANYPIGSIVVSLNNNNPNTYLLGGSSSAWNKVGEGLVLQGSNASHAAGTTIPAGLPALPEIDILYRVDSTLSGVYDSKYGHDGKTGTNPGTNPGTDEYMQSSLADGYNLAPYGAEYSSSNFYGKSTTVQPPALVVNIWKRVK